MVAGTQTVGSLTAAGHLLQINLATRRCRVVLVDDHPMFLSALERFLSSKAEIQVIGSSTTSRHALELVERNHPDLVLVSVGMRDISGTEMARRFVGKLVGPKVILMGLDDDPVYRQAAQAAGACGYLPKMELSRQVVSMIGSVFSSHGFSVVNESS